MTHATASAAWRSWKAMSDERLEHPVGEKGLMLSLNEVVRMAREGMRHPRVRAWVTHTLRDAGNPKGIVPRADALLAALRKQAIWVPDPDHTEQMIGAHLILDDIFAGGDCDDLTIAYVAALGAAMESINGRVAIVGHAYDGGAYGHVLCALFDGDNWLFADPSTSKPIGVAVGNVTDEIMLDVMTGEIICKGICMVNGSKRAPAPKGIAGPGVFQRINGIPGYDTMNKAMLGRFEPGDEEGSSDEEYSPEACSHVVGKFAIHAEVGYDGKPEPRRVEIACLKCGKDWKGECTTPKALIDRFGKVHAGCLGPAPSSTDTAPPEAPAALGCAVPVPVIQPVMAVLGAEAEVETPDSWRDAWREHVDLTRSYLLTRVRLGKNAAETGVLPRLMANQERLGRLVENVSKGSGPTATALLKDHIAKAGAYIEVLLDDKKPFADPVDTKAAMFAWYKNGERIAQALSSAGFGDANDLREMMWNHLDVTGKEIKAEIGKKTEDSLRWYNEAVMQAQMMADEFAKKVAS